MDRPGAGRQIARVRLAIAVVIMIAALEVVGGLLGGSFALLSDAAHLAADSATLSLTWLALARARRPAGARHTFGHHRNGILVAAVNALVLAAIAAVIAVGALSRLQHPVTLHAAPVIVVAALAMVANAAIATMLHGAGGGLGVRSAALHVIADALTDGAVIASALAVAVLGWRSADAVVSLLIAALILGGALRLLAEALQILNEGTPKDLDVEAVRSRIAAIPGIEGVHDLHIWSLDREHRALSAHVSVADRPLGQVTALIRSLEQMLCDEFAIEHATVQAECPSCVASPTLYCDPGRHELVHEATHAAR